MKQGGGHWGQYQGNLNPIERNVTVSVYDFSLLPDFSFPKLYGIICPVRIIKCVPVTDENIQHI